MNTKALTVDNQAIEVEAQKTFAVVSQEVKRGLGPKRVLTEIIIDERAIDLVEEETLADRTMAELGNVTFRTRDVVELFRESLQLAPKICEALVMDCEDVEKFFETNDMKMAQERIGELTSLLEWLLQLISGMQTIGGQKLDEMKFGNVNVSDSVNKMQFLLGKLHLQLAGKQWDLFRQTLKDDFKPEIVSWKALFSDAAESWTPQASTRDS